MEHAPEQDNASGGYEGTVKESDLPLLLAKMISMKE